MKYDFTKLRQYMTQLQMYQNENGESFLNLDEIEERLGLYYEMLIEKNKVMNLTAITEFNEVLEKHFLDSISLCSYINLNMPLKILDLGTGAGFPGLPLKIVFPRLEILLVDSLNKRIQFLNDVIRELELTHILALHGRAEDLARKQEYRQQFDLCLSRAVANLSSLSEYCLPFVKQGGKFISYKSGEVDKEVDAAKYAIHLLGGKLSKTQKFILSGTDYQRSFVFVDKVENTAKKYPRKAGTPGKDPLGKC